MSIFEITIQRREEDAWPAVVRHQPDAGALAQWSRGRLDLDLQAVDPLPPAEKDYGLLLGKALFRDDIRDAFVRALAEAKGTAQPLRVLLIVEADDLRGLHWEQLCAPLDRGWDYLLLNQATPFSLYLPSQIERRFPPIGRRDLRALVLVAGPEELGEGTGLAPFDVAATVRSIQDALGDIPCDLLASLEGAIGPPTLEALCGHLAAGGTAGGYTLLHLVCHGAYRPDSGETILYFPRQEGAEPVRATELIERLSRLARLPHLTFLSTCESAAPRAETGLGGLGQRLVRELGMPAVVAMTDRVAVETAQALASAFYGRLREHGQVDTALATALAGLQGRYDLTVPALFSRLGGRPLFSDALDRPLTGAEIGYGLEQARALVGQRAPVLAAELEAHAAKLGAALGAEVAALSPPARRELEAALAAVNQLCSDALDLSFNALAVGQKPPEYDARCPFRGLFPFRTEDQEFFFGREALVGKLAGRMEEHGFLAVLGPSGSGKSSLVLAGLVPALQERTPGLRLAYLQPGSDPPAQLEAALASAAAESSAQAGGGDGQSPLIVVDQFEELFTLCTDGARRQAFADRLLALSRTNQIVLTLRADFWGECAAYPALKEEMQAHQELVGPMDAAELRGAMERQADHVGLRFEAGLSEDVLDDVQGEPGAMPLLQHALLLLWHRRHGRWLRWEEYRAIGGIRQAIAHTADEVYAGLSDAERERMRDIFLRLTRLEDRPAQGEVRDTRRRVGLAELVPAGGDAAAMVALVKRLADARLVVTGLNAASGGEEVEVAHEALIRHWPRLRSWLDEDRARLRLREDVRDAALEWAAHGRDETYLVHRGGRLEDAELLGKGQRFALNELEQAYVDACVALRERERQEREEQQRRELEAARRLADEQRARAEEQAAGAARMRRRALAIGAVGVVAIVLAVLSMLFWRQANTQKAIAVTNEAAANAESTRAVANEAEANSQREIAVTNEARANAESTRAVANEAEANSQRAIAVTNEAKANAESTRAVANAATAEANAEIARARELAALAQGQLDKDLDLALLLSAEAFQTADTLQSRQVLFDPWSHSAQSSRFLQGHQDAVKSVAWSTDGRLASGADDGSVIVWDLELGQPTQTLQGHGERVNSVAWSKDGRLASGTTDGSVIVWDLERGQPLQILQGHTLPPLSVAWSNDGRLASGAADGTIIIWDLELSQSAQSLEGDGGRVYSVAWSTDGRLASGSADHTVVVWDLELGQPAQTLQAHEQGVRSVAWSADGRLASGSYDSSVIVWDLELGRPAQTLEGAEQPVLSVAWSEDGRLASGLQDGTVLTWDLEHGQLAQTLQAHDKAVYSVAWSPDGRLASGARDATVIVWDLERDQLAQTLHGHEGPVYSVAWFPDGQLASGAEDGTVIIWDLLRGQPSQTLQEYGGPVFGVAWSPDGRLASGAEDGTLIIWGPELSQPDQALQGHSDAVNSVAWSADGRLASGADDGTIIIWDLERDQPAQTLQGHTDWVYSVAWSEDGRLASGAEDGTVIVWDLERGEAAQALQGHDEAVLSVAWSADGRLASSSEDTTVIVWDLDGGQPLLTLEGHGDAVNSVAWSADGRLASGSGDDTAIVWDLERGQPAHILPGHGTDVLSVAWSADRRLASALADGTVEVWSMDPQVWMAEACQRAGRNLTAAEWALYFPDEAYRKTCEKWPAGE